jgi:GAF domain
MDQGSFQRLLSAAFVLQQHNDRLQLGKPDSGYAKTLTAILEIQEQIRSRRLDLQAAASLIARRIREITDATGAAVAILEQDQLEYYAASGSAAGEAGSREPAGSSLAAECLRSGMILKCPKAETDPRLSSELCHLLNVKALIAAPLSYEGKVAGVLELHFAQADSFGEHEVRTCQLMAALLAELIADNAEREAQPAASAERPVASEPASGLGSPPTEEIKLKMVPQADGPIIVSAPPAVEPEPTPPAAPFPAAPSSSGPSSFGASPTGPSSADPSPVTPSPLPQPESAPLGGTECQACGQHLAEDEVFCEHCGTARHSASTWSSLWEMQRAAEKDAGGVSSPEIATGEDSHPELAVLPSELEDIVAQFSQEQAGVTPVGPPEVTRPEAVSPSPVTGLPRYRISDPVDTVPEDRPSGAVAASSSAAHSPATWDFPHDPPQEPAQGLPASETKTTQEIARHVDPAYAAGEHFLSSGTELSAAEAPYPNESLAVEARSSSWLANHWRAQRANIYVAAAALLLLAALFGWGPSETPPAQNANSSSPGHSRKRVAPQPELSFFDKLLVDLGLAEAPPPPADLGNPQTQVWVDVHTALYYCPGADLYGKTPGGKVTSQSDAQQDQFEPAARRPCN